MRTALEGKSIRFKVTNDEQIATFRYSADEGRSWKLVDLRMDVTGYNQNTFWGFLALKIGIYGAGNGSIRLSNFRYRAIA